MSRPIPEAYRDALDAPCSTCGAQPGEFCLVHDDRHGLRVRRVPCVRRCPPASRPSPDEPVRPPLSDQYRSFSEPLHDPTDNEERPR